MKKTVFTLLLAGAVVFCPSLAVGQEQEAVQAETVQKGVIGDGGIIQRPITDIDPAEPVEGKIQATTLAGVDAAVKQVLGEVYTETLDVGGIPDAQWKEMEPIAEEYVNALFQARLTKDDETANQIYQEARQKYEAAINAKLTPAQKTARVSKNAQLDVWHREKMEQITSTTDELYRQAKANGGTATITTNTENVTNTQTQK